MMEKREIVRIADLDLPGNQSAFLWGPRKVGKSYWLKKKFAGGPYIDLLKSDMFSEYSTRPQLLRERHLRHEGLVIIDEIQKVPALLDEVHWLIENSGCRFLLTGSSARKLRKGHANLLGGRAWKRHMMPFTYFETGFSDLEQVFRSGLIPDHYFSPNPQEDLRAYVSDYLQEEIAAEAERFSLPVFSAFLKAAALTSSELLNYTDMARELGVSQRAVRGYFDMLEDTLLAFRIPAWRKSDNRRMLTSEKLYLFDVGVANYLARRNPAAGSSDFGKSFEHLICMELMAYKWYRNPELPLHFWRTSSGLEVDFILGERDAAIEVRAKNYVQKSDLKPLRHLNEDGPVKRNIVVCLEREPRYPEGGVEILPWKIFLDQLWQGSIL